MNTFLNTHKQSFKEFVDAICTIAPERATTAIPPSYATPITILNRLPLANREGFPSLPYLIDQAKECANLVELWLDSRHEIPANFKRTEELNRFDSLCETLHDKSKHCVERMNREQGVQDPKWEELVEQMERKAHLRDSQAQLSPPVQESITSSASSFSDSYFNQFREYGPLDEVRRQPRANLYRVYHHDLSPDEPDPFNPTMDTSHGGSWRPETYENDTDGPFTLPDERRPTGTLGTDHRQIRRTGPASADSHQSSIISLATSSIQPDPGTPGTLSPVSINEGMGRSIYSLTPHRPASAMQHRSHHGSSSRRAGAGRTMSGGMEHRSVRDQKSKSIYRLPSGSSPGPGAGPERGGRAGEGTTITPPKSPPSRDGGRRFGDWSSFLGKRGKDRQ